VRTTGLATKLELSADRTMLDADGRDLAFITVMAVDRDGKRVPTAGNLVRFSVSGPATIAAVGNGDPTDHGSFQSDKSRAFHGQCLVILRSGEGVGGQIILTADSDSLKSGNVVITNVQRP
jgi:beta-galactosidase